MINSIFNKIKKKKINFGETFAVQTGDYVGEMFVYMETIEEKYHFLSMPKMELREVPIDEFDNGLQYDIIEYVEILPRNTLKVVKKQYNVLRDPD